jgi:hypothetical protein
MPRKTGARLRLTGLCALLPLGCSLLAPPDSELVGGTRPGGEAGTSTSGGNDGAGANATAGSEALGGSSGGDGASDAGGMAGASDEPTGGNAPGKPVNVGTPTGDWVAGSGIKTRFAAEVEPATVHRDYPRPRLTRRTWATLNGLWDFAVDASATKVPAFGDAKILVPFPLEAPLSGVQAGLLNADDFLWYHRVFTLPPAWRGQRVLLHFGAVDWDASVSLNGSEVVTHRGGYDAFSVDVTDALAEAAEQDIVVRVADPTDSGIQPRGKQALVPDTGNSFSSISGIWQSVWLEPVPPLSIQDVAFDGDPATGAVTVTPQLSGAAEGTTFRAIVREDGVEVARGEGKDGEAFDVTVPEPKAWSPDSPSLYDVTLELEQDGAVTDTADSYFGLRTVALGADAGVTKVLVNGQPFVGVGVLSHGYWPEGLYTPPNDAAVKADLTLVKNLGFNTIRVHEKIESERFYYWADRLGLFVWQDMPTGDNDTEEGRASFGGELAAIVGERQSHPSLSVWTLFTGGLGQKGADVPMLVERVKALTTSQLIIGASGTGDDGSGDIRDRPDAGAVTCPVPDTRAVALGSYGSFARAIQGHTWGGTGAAAQSAVDTARYVGLARRARGLAQRPGLSTAIYRQLTDVENELDGLVTYDRQVTKVAAKTVAEANTDATTPVVPLLQASEFELKPQYLKDAQLFRYTTTLPASQFIDANFDDTSWTPAPAGIGDTPDAGARTRTLLSFGELWARTSFTLDEKPTGRLIMRMMYDEETQVWVNGVLAVDLNGYTNKYADYLGSDAAVAALVKGKNTIAVHTYNTNGGRYTDVGLWLTDDPPDYRPADAPATAAAGLAYSDYANLTVNSLPADIGVNAPTQTGTASVVGSYTPALPADNARGLRLQGYVEVAQDGIYTFIVDTDDGARLKIGTQAVTEALRNDGSGVTQRAGNIALAKGKHEITIDYFANDNQGANVFNVSWAGPGFGAMPIAAGNLTH